MSVLNRPMFMNKGGQMRHDERTIRNVDDELYRIAPKTHDRGSERIDAREEYARDLREKDYLRAQMNRLANGGQPMPMMAPPPMPMAPPPEAQVQMTEDAAAQQGEMLGTEYVDQMMTGIDSADSTEELIDAIRGNDKTLQDRYDELANFVGERDASATPESVLTLVQPTIMMTEQGAMDSGIGELMQGITGEVEMETEMGAPTPMGQGVGELMMSESVEEVIPEMNQGGPVPVQHFQDAGEVTFPGAGATGGKGDQVYMDLINQAAMMGYQQGLNAPSPDRIQSSMDAYRPLYEQFLGFTDQDRDLAKSQVYFDIASRGLALAGGVNPDTGQPMTGGTLSQIAQAAQTAPRLMAQVGAQQRASERAVDQAALGQAINEETMRKQAEYAALVRQAGKNVDDRRVVGEDNSNLGTFDLNNPREYREYTTLITRLDDANKTYDVFKVGVEPVDRFESGIRSTAAEAADKGLSDYTEQAGLARDTIEGLSRTIQGLNAAQEEGGFRPGFASDFRLGLTRLADFLGVEEEFSNTLGRGDQAENLSAATAYLMSQAAGQLGRVTNLSLITLRDSLPSLGKTLGGNILITQALMEANQKDVLLGDVSDYYYKEFGPDSDNPAANFLRPTSTELTPERRDFLENYGVILPPDKETMPSMYAVETQIKNASDSPALQQLSELSIALQEGRELPPQFTVPDNENSLFESILNAGGRVIDQVVGGEDSVLNTTGMDNNQILQATQEFFENNPTADQMLVRDADGSVFVRRRP
jgi:hypothetical protein